MAAGLAHRIGSRIRERREELDLTQEDVARAMPGKTSGNQVSRWERGANRPGDVQLEHLAAALQVDIAYFVVATKVERAPASLSRSTEPEWAARIEAKLDELLRLVREKAAMPANLRAEMEEELGARAEEARRSELPDVPAVPSTRGRDHHRRAR